jgi:hypothetical protein
MGLYLNYFKQNLYEFIFAQHDRWGKKNSAAVADSARYSGGLPFWIRGKQVKPAPVFWRASSKARTRILAGFKSPTRQSQRYGDGA